MDFILEKAYDAERERWDIEISGEVDIFNSDSLKAQLMELINEKEVDMHIDCRNLEYIDSTALGVLVAVLKNVKSFGGQIYLLNMRSNLLKLFKITNLDKVFSIEGEANAK